MLCTILSGKLSSGKKLASLYFNLCCFFGGCVGAENIRLETESSQTHSLSSRKKQRNGEEKKLNRGEKLRALRTHTRSHPQSCNLRPQQLTLAVHESGRHNGGIDFSTGALDREWARRVGAREGRD